MIDIYDIVSTGEWVCINPTGGTNYVDHDAGDIIDMAICILISYRREVLCVSTSMPHIGLVAYIPDRGYDGKYLPMHMFSDKERFVIKMAGIGNVDWQTKLTYLNGMIEWYCRMGYGDD